LAAILMQESSYNLSAKNKKCGFSEETGKRACIIQDYGVGQINYKTIEYLKLDKKRLTTDLSYSVDAAAKVLSNFKKMYGHKEIDFWTRYNSSNKNKRLVYKRLVERYM